MANPQQQAPQRASRSQTPTLASLEQQRHGPVWVLNNTQGAERSIICLSVPKMSGDGLDTVTIPVTFLPVDLTGQVPREQLMRSSQFRRAVSGGGLMLVSEEEAQAALDKPEAKFELARLETASRGVVSASMTTTTGASDTEVTQADVSPRVRSFLASVEDATDSVEARATLRSMGRLTEPEYRAIIGASKDRRGFEDLAKLAEELLSAIK